MRLSKMATSLTETKKRINKMKEQNKNIPIANQYDKYCENLMFEIESEEYLDFDEDLELEAYREHLMDLEDYELSD